MSSTDAVPMGSQAAGITERKEVVEGGPGHAEGHNTNAALWIGAAFAVKEAIAKHNLAGTIKLFSAPAEEQVISRPFFVRDGYLKDVDAAFHAHVAPACLRATASDSMPSCRWSTSSSAKRPCGGVTWTGVSAADAVKLMDVAWDALPRALAADAAQSLRDRQCGRPAQRRARLREDLVLSPGVDLRGCPEPVRKSSKGRRRCVHHDGNDLERKCHVRLLAHKG